MRRRRKIKTVKRYHIKYARRARQRSFKGLTSTLKHAFRDLDLVIPENPRILNIGGVNSIENAALYLFFKEPRTIVLDMNKSYLDRLSNDFIEKKVHDDALNLPRSKLGQFDIIFSRHPPIEDYVLVSEDPAHPEKIIAWDIVLRQLCVSNTTGGVLFFTFYEETEQKRALKKLRHYDVKKEGRNPHRTFFSKREVRMLVKAGFCGLREYKKSVTLDNYFLLAQNTYVSPVVEKEESLLSKLGRKLSSYLPGR